MSLILISAYRAHIQTHGASHIAIKSTTLPTEPVPSYSLENNINFVVFVFCSVSTHKSIPNGLFYMFWGGTIKFSHSKEFKNNIFKV